MEHEQEQKKKDRLEKESAVRDLLIHFGYMDDPDSFLAVAPMQDFIKANRSRLRTTSKYPSAWNFATRFELLEAAISECGQDGWEKA